MIDRSLWRNFIDREVKDPGSFGDGGDVKPPNRRARSRWANDRRASLDLEDVDKEDRDKEDDATYLRSILAIMPQAMIIIDASGLITSFSSAAERLFGYDAAEVIGRNVAMLMPPPEAAQHDSHIEHYLETRRRKMIGVSRRLIGRRKDGSTFPHELTLGEVESPNGHAFIGFVTDLSEREAAEAKLHELQQELLQISRVSALGTMAATLAHEINQPLTAIASYVQTSAALLEDLDGTAAALVREALAAAGAEALRVSRVIRRMRNFIARGDCQKTREALLKLIHDTCALAMAAERGSAIKLVIDQPIDNHVLLVDRIQIQQVLLNLLRNGMDAMAERGSGEIVISTASRDGLVMVTVKDDGPGISDEVARHLFEPFHSTKASGMGLGLSISRSIIEAHGGRIWAESGRPGGSAFHFTLPIDPAAAAAEAETEAADV